MRIVGLCLVAVFAVSAVVASSASAISFAKPAGGFPILFLSKGGEATFPPVGASGVRCKSFDNHGLIKTGTLGVALFLFLGCTYKVISFMFGCSNTSNPQAIDMALAFHLGLALPGNIPATLLLLPGGKVEIECSKGVKIVLKGSVIGLLRELDTNPLKTKTKYNGVLLAFGQTGGKQNDQTFDPSLGGGERKNVHLTQELNGMAEEEIGTEMLDTLDTFKAANGEATELELLN
jgi:hypothetical protein